MRRLLAAVPTVRAEMRRLWWAIAIDMIMLGGFGTLALGWFWGVVIALAVPVLLPVATLLVVAWRTPDYRRGI